MQAFQNREALFSLCRKAEMFTHVEEGGSYAIQSVGRHFYLFFQESNGREDWKNNLDFFPVRYTEGAESIYCHRGFLRVWQAVKPYVADAIADRFYREITLIGYSHGAALAILCAFYCGVYRRDLCTETVLFGCPRVLWMPRKTISKVYFRKTESVQCGADIVTHLPPAFLGYRHVGTLYSIGSGFAPIRQHTPRAYTDALREEKRTAVRAVLRAEF